MNYPLELRFKVVALASQIYVHDGSGNELFYIKQKLFKLKEKIEIYHDSNKSRLAYTINADRIIDFSPLFTLTDANGNAVATIKRQGRASLWKATYDIALGGQPYAQVKEAKGWVKVADALLSAVPILSIFSGYVFHPEYFITSPDGQSIATLTKQPAFFEGRFKIEAQSLANMTEEQQSQITALIMMVVLMERSRG